MAEFNEELVINALHTDKAEIGKKYWFADNIATLKELVEFEKKDANILYYLTNTSTPFVKEGNYAYQFIYPYEEPPKKRMTYRQLSEWLAKGNGECTDSKGEYCMPMSTASYSEERRNESVWQGLVIRHWNSEEWIEPTVDIYERDCKGGKE